MATIEELAERVSKLETQAPLGERLSRLEGQFALFLIGLALLVGAGITIAIQVLLPAAQNS